MANPRAADRERQRTLKLINLEVASQQQAVTRDRLGPSGAVGLCCIVLWFLFETLKDRSGTAGAVQAGGPVFVATTSLALALFLIASPAMEPQSAVVRDDGVLRAAYGYLTIWGISLVAATVVVDGSLSPGRVAVGLWWLLLTVGTGYGYVNPRRVLLITVVTGPRLRRGWIWALIQIGMALVACSWIDWDSVSDLKIGSLMTCLFGLLYTIPLHEAQKARLEYLRGLRKDLLLERAPLWLLRLQLEEHVAGSSLRQFFGPRVKALWEQVELALTSRKARQAFEKGLEEIEAELKVVKEPRDAAQREYLSCVRDSIRRARDSVLESPQELP